MWIQQHSGRQARNMANKITAYMDDPDMMAQHGEQGRHLAVQKFSIQAMVDQYESVYRGL